MDRHEAQRIIDLAVSCATADDTDVTLSVDARSSTRFSSNAISQNMTRTDRVLSIRSAFGQKVGSATVNDLSEQGVRLAVQRAEAIARAAEPNNEYVPSVGPQDYPKIPGFSAETASFSPGDRAEAVARVVDEAKKINGEAAGSIATNCGASAIGNARGLFGYHEDSDFALTVTAIADGCTGWAEQSGVDVSDLDAGAVAARACKKADLARNPKTIDAKPYPTILEAPAALEMLDFMVWSMDAKSADEGRSGFARRQGTQIAAPCVSLRTDPYDPRCPGSPWGEGGEVSPQTVWIEDGILKTLAYNRFYAQEQGKAYTGGAGWLVMAGQDASTEDLISAVDYGVLVTRFWYIRSVDPMQLLFTGMTRDGLFLIEGGEITSSITNFRFNESPVRMLQNVEALGEAEHCSVYGSSVIPPMRLSQFQFTSGTTF